MFSMLPTPAHSHRQIRHYTPVVSSPLSSSPLRSSPSPLSPRSSNLPTPERASSKFCNQMMSPTPPPMFNLNKIPYTSSSRSSGSSRESVFSKRPTKPNPLLNKGDEEGRETRRKLFLKKVKESSEDRKWRARGGEDEMMRTIWVMEERRRIARQQELVGAEEDEYLSMDDVMVEQVEEVEEKELYALLELMGGASSQEEDILPSWNSAMNSSNTVESNQYLHESTPETPYGSDDDEYDSIFMDVIEEEARISSQQPPQSAELDADEDMMDMS